MPGGIHVFTLCTMAYTFIQPPHFLCSTSVFQTMTTSRTLGPSRRHASLADRISSTAVEQQLSRLLQCLKAPLVPHVMASPQALPGGSTEYLTGSPDAVLDVYMNGERLASGSLGGIAELRQQQEAASKKRQLRLVIETCPELALMLRCLGQRRLSP